MKVISLVGVCDVVWYQITWRSMQSLSRCFYKKVPKLWLHPQGTMIVYNQTLGNPSNSCQDIDNWVFIQNIKKIHAFVVEVFHSGPQRWTDHVAKKNKQSSCISKQWGTFAHRKPYWRIPFSRMSAHWPHPRLKENIKILEFHSHHLRAPSISKCRTGAGPAPDVVYPDH